MAQKIIQICTWPGKALFEFVQKNVMLFCQKQRFYLMTSVKMSSPICRHLVNHSITHVVNQRNLRLRAVYILKSRSCRSDDHLLTDMGASQTHWEAKHSLSAKRQKRILSTVETFKAQQQLILFIHYQVMAGNNCTQSSDHTMNRECSTSNDCFSKFLSAFCQGRTKLSNFQPSFSLPSQGNWYQIPPSLLCKLRLHGCNYKIYSPPSKKEGHERSMVEGSFILQKV